MIHFDSVTRFAYGLSEPKKKQSRTRMLFYEALDLLMRPNLRALPNFFGQSAFLLLAGCTLLPALSGCNPPSGGSGSGTAGESANSARNADTSGGGSAASGDSKTLVIEGSDTLLPLAQKWAEEFKKKNPDANITVSGGGSGQGIKSLINGTATIADASREAEDKEKQQAKEKGFELTETAVARDGITIIVNPANPIKSLTIASSRHLHRKGQQLERAWRQRPEDHDIRA
jgi:ABC-type phosphate transport system substrate-binding protein